MNLARLTQYPVKSIAGHDLAAASFGLLGLENDRRWAVMHPSGQIATRRELAKLARLHAVSTDFGISLSYDGERLDVPFPTQAPTTVKVFSTIIENVQDAGNYASHFLSSALEQSARLVYFPQTANRSIPFDIQGVSHQTAFADGFPVLVTTMPSLYALNAELADPVDIRRFRPNVVIRGDFEPWAEDEWRLIRIGTVLLRIVKPCERCVMITQDAQTGEIVRRGEPLTTLRRIHRASNGKIIFGQNAVIEKQGLMTIGDEVEILESGPSNLI